MAATNTLRVVISTATGVVFDEAVQGAALRIEHGIIDFKGVRDAYVTSFEHCELQVHAGERQPSFALSRCVASLRGGTLTLLGEQEAAVKSSVGVA